MTKRSSISDKDGSGKKRSKRDEADVPNEDAWKTLLNGLSFEKFQSEYFEKKHLHVKGTSCKGLFSQEKLLSILDEEELEYTQDLTVCVYKDMQRQNYEPEDESAHANRKEVKRLQDEGYSVQFYQPQRYVDNLCEINAKLEQMFGSLAGASA